MTNYEIAQVKFNNVYDVIDSFNSDDVDSLFDERTNKLMNDWENFGFIKKDLSTGDILNVREIHNAESNKINVLLDCGLAISSNLKKEREFFELNEIEFENLSDLSSWIESEECKEWLKDN